MRIVIGFIFSTIALPLLAQNVFLDNIQDCWIPVAEKEIQAFENDIGFGLPTKYAEFLMSTNGGSLPNVLRLQAPSGITSTSNVAASEMYSLRCPKSLSYRSLDQEFSLHKGRIPSNTIPIGSTQDDLILLDCSTGEVLNWCRDEELDFDDPEDNRHVIASSFDDFASKHKMKSVSLRRANSLERTEPFISTEAHDSASFAKWKASLRGGIEAFDEKKKLFQVACQARNVRIVDLLLQSGFDSRSKGLLEYVDDQSWDTMLLLLERGADHNSALKHVSDVARAVIAEWLAGNLAGPTSNRTKDEK